MAAGGTAIRKHLTKKGRRGIKKERDVRERSNMPQTVKLPGVKASSEVGRSATKIWVKGVRRCQRGHRRGPHD